MPVYVDPLFSCAPSPRWRWREACHLTGDDLSDLHAFAARLGLRRAWFQNEPGKLPHYDLTKGKREQAVKLGAVEITRREIGERARAYRAAYFETQRNSGEDSR